MIDMEAADEPLRKTEDEIETLRDPSHVKNVSKNEMLELNVIVRQQEGLQKQTAAYK